MSFKRPRLGPPAAATRTQPLALRLGPWRWAKRPREESAISRAVLSNGRARVASAPASQHPLTPSLVVTTRSEEHTSELQSRLHLVCRLLLEKKKKKKKNKTMNKSKYSSE